jgi:hypothetical protein
MKEQFKKHFSKQQHGYIPSKLNIKYFIIIIQHNNSFGDGK